MRVAAGHVYKVSFLVKASVLAAGAIAVTPQLNGVSQTNFVATSSVLLTSLTASAAGTFLVNTLASAAVDITFLYSSSLTASSPTGVITIVEVQ